MCSSDGATINKLCLRMREIDTLLNQMRGKWPQFNMDGIKNVWIVKPGAKSRGRGSGQLPTEYLTILEYLR